MVFQQCYKLLITGCMPRWMYAQTTSLCLTFFQLHTLSDISTKPKHQLAQHHTSSNSGEVRNNTHLLQTVSHDCRSAGQLVQPPQTPCEACPQPCPHAALPALPEAEVFCTPVVLALPTCIMYNSFVHPCGGPPTPEHTTTHLSFPHHLSSTGVRAYSKRARKRIRDKQARWMPHSGHDTVLNLALTRVLNLWSPATHAGKTRRTPCQPRRSPRAG